MSDDGVLSERERVLSAVALGAVLGLMVWLLGRRAPREGRLNPRRNG